ncbi:hypothetical protein ACFVRD_36810 [Streptomyces sp. NPDC057908]|uniref:hypothetical protein n=1 Tax=Streptomyces sp. NPDC057908 TaxID=3346276 RepID=UPI0036EE1EB9
MSETDNTSSEPGRQLPLTPIDEARLARAVTLQQIGAAVLTDLPTADETYDPLHAALDIARHAERLVQQAVILKREQGASWAAIGKEAGISRQAAHERWGSAVDSWVMLGRHRATGPDYTVEQLDEWYADLDSSRQHAVSSGLSSLNDEAARRTAQDQRAEVLRLHAELSTYPEMGREAFNRAIEATGTDEHPARRREWAAVHLAHAAILDRLAVLEPVAAEQHRRRAGIQRGLANDVAADKTPTTHVRH